MPGHFLWKILNPQAAREEEEERAARSQRVKQLLIQCDQLEEWGKVVNEPRASSDALQRVAGEYVTTWWEMYWEIRQVDELTLLEHYTRWHENFQKKIMAHPNLPPDLLGHSLQINEHTVAGLLRNPTLPLILLEHPDFLENLGWENQRGFTQLVLQQETASPQLLGALEEMRDPWVALEAQTHLASENSDLPATPDLDWLDAQIIRRLREDQTSLRCLIYELVCHGVLPREIEPVTPWESSATVTDTAQSILRGLIGEINGFTPQSEGERDTSLFAWLELMLTDEELQTKAPYVEAALAHPDTPGWVRESLARGWPWGRENEFTWSLHRVLILRHGNPTEKVLREFRAEAVREALRKSLRYDDSNPGIFYFIVRELPIVLFKAYVNPEHHAFEDIKALPFPARLAVALRLSDTDPKHTEWREILCNDPNRYVRAASRKEICWPCGQ